MVSPSVSSPSKYLVGRTGDTHAITSLTVAVLFGDVICFGERSVGGGVPLAFLGEDSGRNSSARLAISRPVIFARR